MYGCKVHLLITELSSVVVLLQKLDLAFFFGAAPGVGDGVRSLHAQLVWSEYLRSLSAEHLVQLTIFSPFLRYEASLYHST
jgi:hypothetical protein